MTVYKKPLSEREQAVCLDEKPVMPDQNMRPLVPEVHEEMVSPMSDVSTGSARKPWLTRTRILLSLTLVLQIAVVTRGITRGEFDYNVDESQHAASGEFVASLLKDAPITHPLQYTYMYYAQYPAMSGVVHWPPLFYLAEGSVFSLLGASVVTARITILLFSLLACMFWFRFVKETHNEWTAALSTAIFSLTPSILLFEKTVMLEIPYLALSIGALYYWYSYLTSERLRCLYWFAVLAGGALLTKQNAIFLVAVCPLSAVLLGKWRLFLSRRVLGPLAVFLILIVPFYGLVAATHWHTIAMDLLGRGIAKGAAHGAADAPRSFHAHGVLFYIKALPEQLGWPFLALAAIGIVSWRRWCERQAAIFMVAWIAGCYLTFTAISHKEARYALCWIPPLALFIAGPVTARWRIRAVQVAAAAAAVWLLAYSVVIGWRYERPYVAGYQALARRTVEATNSGIILFEARLPANFIFFLRNLDDKRHFMVLRKALWSTRIKRSGGMEEFATTSDQVRDVIEKDGVKYVVTSDQADRSMAQKGLRDLLEQDSRFEVVGVFPIESNQEEWKNKHLFLYRNRLAAPPTDEFLHIRMMTLSHDIVLPWSQFKQVW